MTSCSQSSLDRNISKMTKTSGSGLIARHFCSTPKAIFEGFVGRPFNKYLPLSAYGRFLQTQCLCRPVQTPTASFVQEAEDI